MKKIRKSVTIREDLDKELKSVAKNIGLSQTMIYNFALSYFLDDIKKNVVGFQDLGFKVNKDNER